MQNASKEALRVIGPIVCAAWLVISLFGYGLWPPRFLPNTSFQPIAAPGVIAALCYVGFFLTLCITCIRTNALRGLRRILVWSAVFACVLIVRDFRFDTMDRFHVMQIMVIPIGAYLAWAKTDVFPRRNACYAAGLCVSFFWFFHWRVIDETSYSWSLPRLLLPILILLAATSCSVIGVELQSIVRRGSRGGGD